MKYFMVFNRIACFFFLVSISCTAHCIITFFFKPYPVSNDADAPEEIVRSMRNSGNMALKSFKNFMENSHLNVGILVTYSGYLAVSDFNGQITLPRTQEEPSFHILVTNRLVPVIMLANTIHHWEIEQNEPAAMYSIERKEDEDTKLLYWNTQKVELPENRRIPLNTIIILAKPKYIYRPEGATVTNTNPQLILPDIYVKKGITHLANALYTLNIRHFFGPVRYAYKKDEKSMVQIISN